MSECASPTRAYRDLTYDERRRNAGASKTCSTLFDLVKQTDRSLTACSEQASTEQEIDWLLQQQFEVLKQAAVTKAQSVDDVLKKLGIWRWLMEEARGERLHPIDEIVYSTFKDLAELQGDDSVLKDQDRRD